MHGFKPVPHSMVAEAKASGFKNRNGNVLKGHLQNGSQTWRTGWGEGRGGEKGDTHIITIKTHRKLHPGSGVLPLA